MNISQDNTHVTSYVRKTDDFQSQIPCYSLSNFRLCPQIDFSSRVPSPIETALRVRPQQGGVRTRVCVYARNERTNTAP